MGLNEEDADLTGAIDDAMLRPDIELLQEGLDTLVGPRGVRLSGGQAQRVATARMLVRGCELLVVDDLSSALDVETERQLWSRLLSRRSSVLAVSNSRAMLRRADRVVLLEEGRVEDAGRLDDLLARSNVMRELWREDKREET